MLVAVHASDHGVFFWENDPLPFPEAVLNKAEELGLVACMPSGAGYGYTIQITNRGRLEIGAEPKSIPGLEYLNTLWHSFVGKFSKR